MSDPFNVAVCDGVLPPTLAAVPVPVATTVAVVGPDALPLTVKLTDDWPPATTSSSASVRGMNIALDSDMSGSFRVRFARLALGPNAVADNEVRIPIPTGAVSKAK